MSYTDFIALYTWRSLGAAGQAIFSDNTIQWTNRAKEALEQRYENLYSVINKQQQYNPLDAVRKKKQMKGKGPLLSAWTIDAHDIKSLDSGSSESLEKRHVDSHLESSGTHNPPPQEDANQAEEHTEDQSREMPLASRHDADSAEQEQVDSEKVTATPERRQVPFSLPSIFHYFSSCVGRGEYPKISSKNQSQGPPIEIVRYDGSFSGFIGSISCTDSITIGK